MTRADLAEWIKVHGCVPQPDESVNRTANVVKFINPDNGRYAYLNTPINQIRLRKATVRRVCMMLVVPIPDYALSEDDE